MFALLKYIPVILGVVKAIRSDPKVRKAYTKAKNKRASGSSR